MDRRTWVDERRAAVRDDYDDTAVTYDADPYPNDGQRRWVERLLATCSPGATVLDAPCGTGRYFEAVRDAWCAVVGIDQSSGMLTRARGRGVATDLHLMGLQELDLPLRFDAAMTIDAMEHVPPEDWPLVVHNVHRLLVPGAHWYVTVEEQDRARLAKTFDELRAEGLPAVNGEVVSPGTGGYHFYPDRQRVAAWLADEGFEIVREETEQLEGWGYWHLLLRAPAAELA